MIHCGAGRRAQRYRGAMQTNPMDAACERDGLFAGAHQVLLSGLRHRLVGALIAAMATAGLVGALVTFWPH